MMSEDLGVEAKESAVKEVAKQLVEPESLLTVSASKSDYIARQQVFLFLGFSGYWIRCGSDLVSCYFFQANDAQLSTMVAEQVRFFCCFRFDFVKSDFVKLLDN